MPRIYVSVGSNIEPRRHIPAALDELAAEFGQLQLSPVYRSEAVGFAGDDFLNLVVGFDSERSVAEVADTLRSIEHRHGRRRGGAKFSSRSLDLDILSYGSLSGEVEGVQLPRDEITRYAFVLKPLAELAGAERHPVSGRSYAELWHDFDAADQKLWPVDFHWRGRVVSRAET